MVGWQAKASSPTAAFLVGVLAMLVALALYLSGGLDLLEYLTLDYRFASEALNPIPQSDQLVSIDIDDRSLDVVGRWPWPRDVQAALISIPAECGAKALLVDLDWNEHQSERLAVPDDADFADVAQPRVAPDSIQWIWPDRELRAAIAQAANVYPAFHNFRSGQIERSPDFTLAYQSLAKGDEAEARRRLARAAGNTRETEPGELWDRVRLAALIAKDPLADPDAPLSESDGSATPAPWRHRVREAVLRDLFATWLDQNQSELQDAAPAAQRDEFFEALTGEPFGIAARSDLQDAVQFAVREVLSLRRTARPPLLSPHAAGFAAREVQAVAPVHFLIAEHAVRPGFVNFEADAALDGVMRRETLAERCGDLVTTQLAFGVGCAALDVGAEQIEANQRELVLRPPGRAPLRFQLDQHQQVLVPWTAAARMNADPARFVPASLLWVVADRRAQIRYNDEIRRSFIRDLLLDPAFGERKEAAQQADAIDLLHSRLDLARLEIKPKTVQALREEIASYQTKLDAAWTAARDERSAHAPQSAPIDDEKAQNILDALEVVDQCAAANTRLQSEANEALQVLRTAFAGKICLLGYTASALADMKPTPIARSLPGVRAHLNLINGMLTGHTVRWLPTWGNAVLVILLGLIASAVGARARRRAMAVSLLLTLLLLAAAALAFRLATYWIAVVAPLVAIWLPHLSVALYQFGFVDRERRALTKTLGQYTSAKLARQMAEQPELCRRAETREVTAMFTDMAGFTTISERIGAERTQRLLNLSLGALSDAMLQHDAMINKFIGDGVFAFWNPLINPQADHARRAALTSIELFTALDRLREAQQRAGGDSAFADLHLRVGVASGNAVVGPCGSEQKYDYTCIGDTVNLAARLESANKFFGTRILVSDHLRELAGPGFAYRPLGAVQVKGKTAGVPVFELLGLESAVSPEARAYSAQFAKVIEAFQQRDWSAALAALDQAASLRPDDVAVDRYRRAIHELQANPPGPDWNGAIELTEK